MTTTLDIACDAYGIRQGDRVGILMHDDVERRRLINTLDRLSCEHVVLDPSKDVTDLSSLIDEMGIRLALTCRSVQEVTSQLSTCIACANFLIERSIHLEDEAERIE